MHVINNKRCILSKSIYISIQLKSNTKTYISKDIQILFLLANPQSQMKL